jgi:hypothetical protein
MELDPGRFSGELPAPGNRELYIRSMRCCVLVRIPEGLHSAPRHPPLLDQQFLYGEAFECIPRTSIDVFNGA